MNQQGLAKNHQVCNEIITSIGHGMAPKIFWVRISGQGSGNWAGLLRYEIFCGLYTPQPSAETFFLLTLNLMGDWCGNLYRHNLYEIMDAGKNGDQRAKSTIGARGQYNLTKK